MKYVYIGYMLEFLINLWYGYEFSGRLHRKVNIFELQNTVFHYHAGNFSPCPRI